MAACAVRGRVLLPELRREPCDREVSGLRHVWTPRGMMGHGIGEGDGDEAEDIEGNRGAT